MGIRENKWLWLGVASVLAAAIVIIWLVATAEPPRLIVLFDEINGLKKDDPVVWRGFTVGKVEDIQPLVENRIGVIIRLREDYAPKITHGTEFVLKRKTLMGLLGSNAIELITPSTPGTPFVRDEKVMGKLERKPSVLEDGKKWSLESWNQLRDYAGLMLEEWRASPYRKDAAEALEQLRSLAAEGASQAREGWQQFRKDHQKDLDGIIRRLEGISAQMRRNGDERNAHRLDGQIEKLRRDAEDPRQKP